MTGEQLDSLVPAFAALCAKEPVVLMYIHGSHAAGEQSFLSDLDIAVLVENDVARDFHFHLRLSAALEDACGREDVDLVVLNNAGPTLRDRVVRRGKLVYARSASERVRFEAHAVKKALDFQYFARAYNDHLFQQLATGRFLD